MESAYYVILLIAINVIIWIILSMIPRLKHRNQIFIVLSFISLWIFLCIREPYSDMIAYNNYFKSIDVDHFERLFDNRWEILFKILLYSIKLITSDTRVMLCIVAFITLIGPYLFIHRYSRSYLLTVVMFIAIGTFHIEFYVLRQAVAMSIVLACFHYIGEKRLLKYCIVIAIASLFHKTALVLLLLYPLVNIPPSKYKNIAITVISVLALVFSSQISNYLISDFYSLYADKVFSGGGVKLFLFYVFIYVVYLLLKKYSPRKEKEEITKASLFTIFMQLFTVQNNAFSRIAAYTRDSFCILIPNAIQELKGKNRMLFSIIVIGGCICYVIITGMFSDYSIMKY